MRNWCRLADGDLIDINEIKYIASTGSDEYEVFFNEEYCPNSWTIDSKDHETIVDRLVPKVIIPSASSVSMSHLDIFK